MAKNAQRKKTVVGPPQTNGIHFGDVLRMAFEKSGMTQAQYAERLGVKQPRIPQIFASRSITEKLLDRCVEALGLRLEIRLVEAEK